MPLPSKALKSPIEQWHHHGPSMSISKSKPKPKRGFVLLSLNRPHVLACKGLEMTVPTEPPNSKVAAKNVDVATLSNLCVDIVLNVPHLPPPSPLQRKAFMDRLALSPPHKKYWEAGGNCNMAIAAARLGLKCLSIGHVGNEIYGEFLLDVLHEEGIGMVGMITEDDIVNGSSSSGASHDTLLCWVLVDPLQRHGFCSRADFSEEPAFHWMSRVSREVKIAIESSKVLFCNGYGFDELSPGVLLSAMEYAVEVGTSVFFDPGPRGKSLSTGTPEERRALNQFLRNSDVLLLTFDEAESLTGIADPILAGQELLKRGIRTKWVIVKMGSKGSILITATSIACAPAFKVNVIDTVGCGDSFVAAIAYGFIHNMPLVNTLAIANAVGAATAMGCGAGRNVATLEKVVHILRSSNLNEDVEFWTDLLEKNEVSQEITCLTSVMNGNRNGLNLVPFDKVASELLPKLEFPRAVGNVQT
ncbi:ribokinase [Abrus precatorius]|uniref:Ribokinase n=1 Tax=Abrus precatorius TaxID=3816 RepID=A0A8B8MCJ8_ABRPR|nr:ribokinase [Abrus precatorius]